MKRTIVFEDWGKTDYLQAWERQKQIFELAIAAKQAGETAINTLVFCEHPPVITIGKSGSRTNLLYDAQALAERGVAYYEIDRGGDVTFHGPGQLVGYPVFDIEQFALGLKSYIYKVEESVIQLLAGYGLCAARLEGATGVWLDTDTPGRTRKICAIGVRSSRYVTMHGFALNVNTDLSYFSLIHPCGFVDKGVTSMQAELGGDEVDMEKVKKELKTIFEKMFQ